MMNCNWVDIRQVLNLRLDIQKLLACLSNTEQKLIVIMIESPVVLVELEYTCYFSNLFLLQWDHDAE